VASRTTGRCLGGVIFDMDGVVIDSEPLSIAIIAEIISEHGGSADPALLAGLAGVNLAEVLEVAAAHSGRTLDTEALHRSYRERYLPRLRATAVPTAGFAALVTALKDAGVPIGLASSSSLAEIDVVVHALRLGPVLAAVASADEVARPKPAPDVYRLAIERLGTGPDGVVAIEDSAPGVTAATAAGLVCVGVRTAVTQAHDLGEVSLLVNSLEELDLGTLERLVRMTPLPDPEVAANLRTAAAGPNAEISCGHGRAGEPQG
jgi:HAD superfamily hydrolase (TIGR01509 family)